MGCFFFISNSIETKERFLDTPNTESNSASGQRFVFLRLCPTEAQYPRFTFRKNFTSKIRNYLAELLELTTFKRDRVKAIFNGLPFFTTSHEGPKMYNSVGT